MKLWTRICAAAILPGICSILLCGHASFAGDTDAIKPVLGVKLALERYEDGKVKTQLIAGKAKPPINGDWEAWEVKIESYTPTGEIESVMTADDCRYSRETGIVKSESNVRLEKEGILITGKGFEWDAKEQIVRILSDVKVVLKGNMDLMKGIKK
jgi:hypothetical protein